MDRQTDALAEYAGALRVVVDKARTRFPNNDTIVEFFREEGVDSDSLNGDGTDDVVLRLRRIFAENHARLLHLRRQTCDQAIELCLKEAQRRPMPSAEVECLMLGIFARFHTLLQDLKTAFSMALAAHKRATGAKAKSRRALDKRVTDILNKWFFEHINDPYPSEEEKQELSRVCQLSLNQINNWFGNKRIRYKRKMLESGRLTEKRAVTASELLPAGMGQGAAAEWSGASDA